MDASLRSRWRAVHRGAGALFGIVLFVILFTGTWSLAQESMQGWWRPPSLAVAGPPLPLERLAARAASLGFALRDARIVLPQPNDPAIRFCTARHACPLALNPATGEPLAHAARAALLVTLHRTMCAGFPGRIFVSLWGVVLLVLIAAGLVLHRRRWPDAARVRRDRGARIACFDLHGWIGLWGAPWLVLFAFTGALSGLGALGTVSLAPAAFPGQPQRVFAQLMGAPPPAAAGRPWSRAPDLDALLRRDAARAPAFRAEVLALHHWGDANASVEIAGTAAGLPSTALFERHLYRAADGQWLADATSRGRGVWLRAFIAVQPLHVARYGWAGTAGGGLRALHFLMGVAACVLCATGLLLWIERRHAHGDARARALAALGAGVCGGLVLAGGVLLFAGRVLPPGARADTALAALFWSTWLGSALLAARVRDRAALARGLMGAAGAAYLLAGAAHLSIALLEAGTPVYGHVDAALAGLGALLLRAARRGRRVATLSAGVPPPHSELL
ncbi:pepSY-associated TM helix family protein [Burkholderia pseudomallei]|uniref:Iron-regulated membrane protein n=1 Tax=Burkholderia pseudomallei (strain 1026b) TaxID=884204 RepID=A0A0H3HVP8_BURP2|nr:PepSY-associated TM helix domain-containing protein [Burkholderia pseudomallei]AFI68915.1 iron-regulated membrane protein [Burkholderia pseudomallei 1026b]AIP17502.1 pepSY-associated TM helix family protein [Burkholderia pseudomallei]EIF61325.1 iron-regulated membrane protein [Burkholderia pseudomallei 1026a]RXS79611.1 PepSY domain-containing protein [Burkholderia pseudomallei]